MSASLKSSARGYRCSPANVTRVERFHVGRAEDLHGRVAFHDGHHVIVAVAVDVADVPLVGDVGIVEDDLLEVGLCPLDRRPRLPGSRTNRKKPGGRQYNPQDAVRTHVNLLPAPSAAPSHVHRGR